MIVNLGKNAVSLKLDELLAPDLTEEKQNENWDSYFISLCRACNFDNTLTDAIIALSDIPAGGKLLKRVPEAELSVYLFNQQLMIIAIKTKLIPESILKSSNTKEINQYWSSVVEPNITYFCDPEAYIPRECCVWIEAFDDRFLSDEELLEARPAIVQLLEDTILRLLYKEFDQQNGDATTNYSEFEKMRKFKAKANHEARFMELERHHNPYKFPIKKEHISL